MVATSPRDPSTAAHRRDLFLGLGLIEVMAVVMAVSSGPLELAQGRSHAIVIAFAAAVGLAAAIITWLGRGRITGRRLLVYPALVLTLTTSVALTTSGVAETYLGFFALSVMFIGITQRRAMVPAFIVAAIPCWLIAQETYAPRTFFRMVVLAIVWWMVGAALASRVANERAHAQALSERANTDPLTGLASRLHLSQQIDRVIAEGSADRCAVLLIDLDGFKGVNDMFGHSAGDELLITLARRIRGAFRPSDVCARLGGDEFAVLLRDIDMIRAADAASRLLLRTAEPVTLSRGRMAVTASIGLTTLAGASDASEALRDADLAMYEAKGKGRNRLSVFERELDERRAARLQLESELHRALAGGQFELYYQPVSHLRTGAVIGAEALLRWNHPRRGVLTPDQFLSTSEEIGVIVALGDWIIHEACRQAVAWQPDDPAKAITMAVNLSAPELLASDFPARLRHALSASGLAPSLLLLEVSERLVVSDAPLIRDRIDEVRQLGVRIAIDDFGTGHSSLAYLRQLPVDILKIDRSFVRSLGEDRQSTGLVKSIIAIADALQLDTIAEGVESADQMRMLTELGCDIAQGHYFAPALPASVVGSQIRRPFEQQRQL